ncbi:MAG: LamG-like jellyroll fold domain-containing protein [Candidatus Pacearchaeota archaeon]
MNKNVGVISIIILVIGVIGIFFLSITGYSIFVLKPNLLLHFNSNIDIINDTNNGIYSIFDTELIDDEIFGKTYNFSGKGNIRTVKKIFVNNSKGYSISAIAYVNDNESHNSLGIVSTSFQNSTSGFRMKYRDFEEADRLYIDIGTTKNEVYYEIPKGKCYKKWCHYAFTYNPNGDVKVYLNGEKVKEFKSLRNLNFNSRINIGNTIDINREFFKGKIFDVQIYEGVLSDKQIKKISENIL